MIPTIDNLLSSVSRSNGFITYSSAPASTAALMWLMPFSVVQKNDLGPSGHLGAGQGLEEFHTAHDRHVPVEQHDVWRSGFALGQRILAVHRFAYRQIERFQYMTGHLADNLRIVDDEAVFHGASL